MIADRLAKAVRRTGSVACVGLDPRPDRLPVAIREQMRGDRPQDWAEAYRQFCFAIIDQVRDRVPCVKPQSAFFEALGPSGVAAMADIIAHARSAGLLVIVDAKRNDIGSTAEGYADAYLGRDSPFGGDFLTVSPYLGSDSLEPFVQAAVERDAGLFVLVKTSNPGGGFLQDRRSDGQRVFEAVADLVEDLSRQHRGDGESNYGPIGAVVGATYPQQLGELRQRMPHSWLLIPGFGAQGGDADDVRHGMDADGLGGIVNSSRAIIFAHARDEFRDRWAPEDWALAVAAATDQMNETLRGVVSPA